MTSRLDERSSMMAMAHEASKKKWDSKKRQREEMLARDAHLTAHPAWLPLLAASQQDESWLFWLLRPDPSGSTPLMRAAMSSEQSCVEILLEHCDPAARDKSGSTALMLAAERGSERCCQLLIARSDPTSTDSAGRDALACARTEACMAAIEPKWLSMFERLALGDCLAPARDRDQEAEPRRL